MIQNNTRALMIDTYTMQFYLVVS